MKPINPVNRRKLSHWLLATACVLLSTGTAFAAQESRPTHFNIASHLQMIGSCQLRSWGLKIYDAKLWSTADFNPTAYAQYPLELELLYQRTLSGKAIAERSIREMQNVARLSREQALKWGREMAAIFPDVSAGDRLKGISQPGGGTSFYLNNRPIGQIQDPSFANLFFGIWLSPRTSEPKLREQLLGLTDGN